MAGGARSISGSGKLSMDATTGAVSGDFGSREPPNNPLVAFSSQPRFSTWHENASTEVIGSTWPVLRLLPAIGSLVRASAFAPSFRRHPQ